jgi:putative membrane protein
MEAVLQSLIAGFPVLMLHSATTFAILVAGALIYLRITPHDEIGLIRAGNTAAAVSFGGALVGMAAPLAFCMAASVSVWDILIWGAVTVVLQIVAYRLTDGVLRDLSARIERGEMASAVFMVSVKLAVAAVNAAAVGG